MTGKIEGGTKTVDAQTSAISPEVVTAMVILAIARLSDLQSTVDQATNVRASRSSSNATTIMGPASKAIRIRTACHRLSQPLAPQITTQSRACQLLLNLMSSAPKMSQPPSQPSALQAVVPLKK